MTIDANTSRKLLADIENANREVRAGRSIDALLIYDAIANRPDLDAAVHAALGHLSLKLTNSYQAVGHFQKSVDSDPDNAMYRGFLGVALQAENRYDEAIVAFKAAMANGNNVPAVLNGLGSIYLHRGDYEQARELLTEAVQAKSSDGIIQTNLAMTLARLNEHETALKHAEKGLKQSPDNLNAHYTYGTILAELGRVEDAVRHFEKTIRQHKQFGGAYNHLARLKKFSSTDQPFISKTEKVLQLGIPAQDRVALHFALGKMYDDCQAWDKSFEHYRQGNLLKKKDYDIGLDKKMFEQHKKMFDRSTLEKYQELGNSSVMPIFIVGMPRSGTTLMERMITGSEGAAGAGELPEIPRIAELIAASHNPRGFAASARSNLHAENIETFAADYLRILRQADKSADRIVDKLPGNYLYLWLISILFPKATIIFAQRHPLDVCLSCYFQNFASFRWADDLSTIAEVYRLHHMIVDHWKSVLPDGKIVDVQYELLVEDPEIHGKQMLESCGLEWRGDGLERYKKEKVVKTASLWQVRQPIYQSSKMRWKNYAPFIADLAAQLPEFLQDDRDELARFNIQLPAPTKLGRIKKLFAG
ncbi:MAG: tetratricopeptide repeat-containing sulfotransferase family protein [Woeseiaceae bacterium]